MALVVASLNILGDAYNPFEFMDNSNPSFEECYLKIRESFETIPTARVLGEIRTKDLAVVGEYALKENFSENCTESFLQRDNKMALINRTNLIVCATKPLQNGLPLFRCANEWRSLISLQYDNYLASGLDIPIMLWDIACCLAVERHLDEYIFVCENSHLNPENLISNFKKLLSPITCYPRSILAVQEFPKEGSANRAALLNVIEQEEMSWTEMFDVGFIYSKSINALNFIHSPLGTEPRSVVSSVQQLLQELPDLQELPNLVDDELVRLGTTARKTIVMDVGEDLRIVAVHVKEFKTEDGTAFLARYLRSLCDEKRLNIMVGDTNIPTATKASIFATSVRVCNLTLHTHLGCITTRKRRSELHGQIYDSAKCLRVVAAHKDFALSWCGPAKDKIQGMWECSDAILHPDLVKETSLLLPNADWPSDHCLVKIVLQPVSG